MWVRGLKHAHTSTLVTAIMSHPMWVRGLKHYPYKGGAHYLRVAPHVGAWIETHNLLVGLL